MNLLDVVAFLADDAPRNTGPDFGKASPFGLLVIVLLLLGTLFLIRSMNRHLKKVPESFDREDPGPDQAPDEGTAAVEDAAEEPADKTQDTHGTGTSTDRNGSPHEPDS